MRLYKTLVGNKDMQMLEQRSIFGCVDVSEASEQNEKGIEKGKECMDIACRINHGEDNKP